MTEKARDEDSEKERRRRQEATLKRRASAEKRPSQDGYKVDTEELKMRARHIINEKDAVMKRHAKGDSDIKGSSRRSSNASDDKNASLSRLRSSTEKKEGRHHSSTGKSSADSGGIKKEGRPQRRTSTESEHKVQSRRSSHDSDDKPKAKAVMDLRPHTSRRISVENRSRPLHRRATANEGLDERETNSHKKLKKRISLDETNTARSFRASHPGARKDKIYLPKERGERSKSMRLAPNRSLDIEAIRRISSSFNEGSGKQKEDKDQLQAEPLARKDKPRKKKERSKSMKLTPEKSISEARAIRRLSSSFGDVFTDINESDDAEPHASRKDKPKKKGERSKSMKLAQKSISEARAIRQLRSSFKGVFTDMDELEDAEPRASKQDKPRKKGERSKSLKLAQKSISETRAIRKLRSSFSGAFTDIDELEDAEPRASRKRKKKAPPYLENGGGDRHSNAKKKEKTERRSSLKRGSRSSQDKRRSRRRQKKNLSTKGRMASPDSSTSSHQGLSSYDEESAEHRKTEPGARSDSTTCRSSPRRQESTGNLSGSESRTTFKRTTWQRFKWRCMCCSTIIIFIAVAVVVALIVLQVMDKSVEINLAMQGSDDAKTKDEPSDAPTVPALAPSADLSTKPTRPRTVGPSISPSLPATTLAPTPSPLANVNIVVIVQLDAKPEETGFSLASADNSTMYISRPIGSLSGQHNEVVMDVISVTEQTVLVFTIEDKSGDGLCCTHGNGYYRVVAGTGDQKIKIVSGEQSAKYLFPAGMKQPALKIGGVDPNEDCKPCPDGKDCGRCAWCNADEGLLPDTIFTYQCHSEPKPVPKKCFIGEKRYQLHNQYVAAMAGCGNGFEAHPQIQTSLEVTVCVEEANCVKTFAFMEPDCDEELSGSLLVKETCQDKIGGIPFGYSWGLNAPREKECPSSGKFAAELAKRCCIDGVAFCSTVNANVDDEIGTTVSDRENIAPTPMPIADNTNAPTESNAPTWDGYPISVLIQLDDFPRETGFTITSVDKEVIYLERPQGYYKQKSQLAVEKVQIPVGTEAVLTLTDEQGDGFCCENGNGYYQIYSDQGSIILDEAGTFAANTSNIFFVGDPKTLPPTVSTSPTVSVAPTFDKFPITIAVQLDQWSAETGFSIQSDDGILTYLDCPAGSFSEQPSSLVVKTVQLPRDAEVNLRVTDAGGDGFCCLYGDGYIKVFAGESADDESQILASEDGDFESDLSIIFRAGPAPSRAPTTTLTPTSTPAAHKGYQLSLQFSIASGITSSSPSVQMTVVLQLDKYSAETGWSIDSSDGLTNFAARPAGYYEENMSQKVIETVSLPEGLEYQFKIIDIMGDGTCCWAGNGWYSLYEGTDVEDLSTQVFYGDGNFGRERVHTFVAGKPKTASPTRSRVPSEMPSDWPSLAPSHSSSPSITKYALEVTIKLDDNSSQTGWYIASEGGIVIIDRPAGWYNGNDTLTVIETVKLEAGEYIFSLLDTNGDGFCCSQGIGFYSLYSNGDLLIFEKGKFEYSHNETFSIYPNSNKTLSTTKSAQMLRGSDPSSYSPNRQRKHGDKDT